MAEKNKLDGALDHSEEILDHDDEKSEHKTNYPGAKEESPLEANNKHLLEFQKELDKINEHAGFAFENREDIGQYQESNRKEMIASHLEAFNNVEFHDNANDRLDAANKIAATIFEPMHKYISTQMYTATNMLESQYNLDPKLVTAMEEEGIQFAEHMIAKDSSGNAALKFMVEDQAAAERLAQRFEGQIVIVTNMEKASEYIPVNADKIIEDYQGKFAETLNLTDGRDENPADAIAAAQAATERLFEIFNEAHDYSRNQWTNEPTDPREISMDEFSELAAMDEPRRYLQVDQVLHNTWKDLLEPINEMNWKMDSRYNGASQVYWELENVHANGLWSALENQNYDGFKAISDSIHDCKEEFSQAMRDDTGFVKLDGYKQHVLPESFSNVEEAHDYSDAINAHLYQVKKENEASGNNETMSSMAHHIATQMRENFNLKLQAIEETQETRSDQTEEYTALYKTAQGLDYIMKSKEDQEASQEADESNSLTEKATVAARVAATAADVATVASAVI